MSAINNTKWTLLGILFFLILATVVMFVVGFVLTGNTELSAAITPGHNVQTSPIIKKVTFGMVTDTDKLRNNTINDSAWEGLTKAGDEFGTTPMIIESESENDYVKNLEQMSSQVDLTIGVGPFMEAAIREVALKYPDRKFATTHCTVDLPNVVSNQFCGNEGAFLVGIAAGLNTETNVIGFLGAEELDFVLSDLAGFIAGVKCVNPGAEVITKYTESWIDMEAGKNAMVFLLEQGADVIMAFAGEAGYPVFVEETMGSFWVIGCDIGNTVPYDKVLCSWSWNDGAACYGTVMSLAIGSYNSGTTVFWGIDQNGVFVSDYGTHLNDETWNEIEDYKRAFSERKYTIPYNMEGLENFSIPDIIR